MRRVGRTGDVDATTRVATGTGGTARTGVGRRPAVALLLGAAVLLSAACGGTEPAAGPASAVDPAVKGYCDTVLRVQSEQTGPQAGQGGVVAASQAARKQVADLAAVAPPEIAADWRTLQSLTDQALGALAATGGDPARIDRAALTRLEQQSQPAVERIKQVTSQRCGIAFRAPA